MSRVGVKVCCISSLEEAALALRFGADALGLVSAMPSGPGIISDERCQEIAAETPPPAASVLLTSLEDPDAIASQARTVGCSTVQLVRHVDTAVHDHLAQVLPVVKRIQVIHVQDHSCMELIPRYGKSAHAFLLDSGAPAPVTLDTAEDNAVAADKTNEELGGTGRTHDWAISAEFVRRSSLPVFLAGGLNPGNVAQTIRDVRPWGVDLCSGVRRDGRLDERKLRAFFGAVNNAH